MKFQINDIRSVWNKQCGISDCDIVKVLSIDSFKSRYYIGKDIEGRNIWISPSDIWENYVTEVYDDSPDQEHKQLIQNFLNCCLMETQGKPVTHQELESLLEFYFNDEMYWDGVDND